MSEPQWVYRQRRQRAAVAVAMVIGLIAMVIVLGPALGGGFDLGGRQRVAINKPDPDAILAREQRQIEAAKQRKAARRQARAERRARPRRPKKPAAPARGTTPSDGSATPAATPPPSPSPAPAAPDPATAKAPQLPQPPQPANGPVDPRFY